ncbi:MAG: histidine phosphatase family protein, partial [Candidatus Dormibacteria bacterium]
MNGRLRTDLYLIRHADAEPADDALLPAEDAYDTVALSERGRTQAEALALRLARSVPLAALYAS